MEVLKEGGGGLLFMPPAFSSVYIIIVIASFIAQVVKTASRTPPTALHQWARPCVTYTF
jgi:hypothetical protein